jgi:hypothetical protein
MTLFAGLHLTDPNASATSNFIVGALDVSIVLLAIFAVFYFRNDKVKKKRAIKQESRNARYQIQRAEKLEKRVASQQVESKYDALPDTHILKKVVKLFSVTGNFAFNIALVVGFVIVVIVVIAIALHNGSCIGPEGDYSNCYP